MQVSDVITELLIHEASLNVEKFKYIFLIIHVF